MDHNKRKSRFFVIFCNSDIAKFENTEVDFQPRKTKILLVYVRRSSRAKISSLSYWRKTSIRPNIR